MYCEYGSLLHGLFLVDIDRPVTARDQPPPMPGVSVITIIHG